MLDRRIEYEKMAQVEREHWWYRALHHLVLRGLQAHVGGKAMRIVDAGCGTGGLLGFLRERGFENVSGFDVSPWGIEICRKRGLVVTEGDLRELPRVAKKGTLDAVVSNDTLYFFNAEERAEILRNFWEVLAPGGLVVLNVPALAGFRGIHDLSVGIRHRFSKAEMVEALPSAGFDIVHAGYWPFLVSPLIYGVRLFQRLRMRFSPGFQVKSDVATPPFLLNRFLESITRIENVRLGWKPLGSSVFVVGRKREA